MKRKVFKTLMAVLIVFIMLVSYQLIGTQNAEAATGSSSNNSKITIGLVGSPSDPFNPLTQTLLFDSYIQSVLYPTLVTVNASGSIVPYLAESYNVSSSGLQYTFNLYPNTKWSNGDVLNASDIVFSLNAYIQNSSQKGSDFSIVAAPSNSTFTGYTLNMSDISTPSSTKVVITLPRPDPGFLTIMATFFMPIPEQVDAGHNLTTNSYINTHLVTAGPWYLASSADYVPSSYMILTANPNFVLGAPNVKTLELEFFQTDFSAESALESGSIQMLNAVPTTDMQKIQSAGFVTSVVPTATTMEVAFNMGQNLTNGTYNPVSNLKVRDALGYAVNMTALVNSISSGLFIPWGQLEPDKMLYDNLPAYNTSLPSTMFPYNISMADQLLNESGYTWNGVGYRMTLSLITLATIPFFVSAAQILKQDWAQIGVNVVVTTQQATQWDSNTISFQPKNWDMDLLSLTEPYAPFLPANFLAVPSITDVASYSNTTVTNLIQNVSFSGNANTVVNAFRYADALINKQAPYLFMDTETEVDAWAHSVTFHDGVGGMMALPLSLYGLTISSPTHSPSNNLGIEIGVAIAAIAVIAGVGTLVVRRRKK